MKILKLLIVVGVLGCSSPDSKNKTNYLLGPDDFKTKVEGGATLIDVRTVEEYASGHITGSLNMDVNNPVFKENILMLNRDKIYAVYCASGVRSGKAAELMRSEGFASVFTLTGGIKTWKEKGLPLE